MTIHVALRSSIIFHLPVSFLKNCRQPKVRGNLSFDWGPGRGAVREMGRVRPASNRLEALGWDMLSAARTGASPRSPSFGRSVVKWGYFNNYPRISRYCPQLRGLWLSRNEVPQRLKPWWSCRLYGRP